MTDEYNEWMRADYAPPPIKDPMVRMILEEKELKGFIHDDLDRRFGEIKDEKPRKQDIDYPRW